jgi:putative tryptophan/tyrosine transport system substrate-binding protein
MRRREFITLLGGLTAWPLAVRAQQGGRAKRILWLRGNAEGPDDGLSQILVQAFERQIASLGWAIGRDIRIEARLFSGDNDQFSTAVKGVVDQAPDVIVATGTQLTAVLKQQTSAIPIVFVNVADPVASGFVASFAHPGGNITGFTSEEYSLAGKWLDLLKDMAPDVARVMFLYNPANANWNGYLRAIEAGAASLGLQISPSAVASFDEITRRVEAFAREPKGGMIVQPSALMIINRERIAKLAAQHRIPTVYPYDHFTRSGGLMSYGSDSLDLYRRAASYVDRILKGEKPADLPVQAPTKFELIINLRSAKAIGLSVPLHLQQLADEVIE